MSSMFDYENLKKELEGINKRNTIREKSLQEQLNDAENRSKIWWVTCISLLKMATTYIAWFIFFGFIGFLVLKIMDIINLYIEIKSQNTKEFIHFVDNLFPKILHILGFGGFGAAIIASVIANKIYKTLEAYHKN